MKHSWLAIVFLAAEIQGTHSYHWTVLYGDPQVDVDWYETNAPRLEFTPRAGLPFRVIVRPDRLYESQPSAWVQPIPEIPAPGWGQYPAPVFYWPPAAPMLVR